MEHVSFGMLHGTREFRRTRAQWFRSDLAGRN